MKNSYLTSLYGISISDIMCIEYRYTCIHTSDTMVIFFLHAFCPEGKSMAFMSSFNPSNHISRVLPPVISSCHIFDQFFQHIYTSTTDCISFVVMLQDAHKKRTHRMRDSSETEKNGRKNSHFSFYCILVFFGVWMGVI